MKKNITRFLLAALTLTLVSAPAFAFRPFKSSDRSPFAIGSNRNNIMAPAPNATAPFDGGISLLVVAGIGYATKKAHDKRKREENKVA